MQRTYNMASSMESVNRTNSSSARHHSNHSNHYSQGQYVNDIDSNRRRRQDAFEEDRGKRPRTQSYSNHSDGLKSRRSDDSLTSRTHHQYQQRPVEAPQPLPSWVVIGTAMPEAETEVNNLTGKLLPVWQQEVVDDQGRKRLHGAFTGGFSAGYFNTCGSKEGWTPSNFVSSRKNRANKNAQKLEDFMDDEDRAEIGGGMKLTAKGDFDSAAIASAQHQLRALTDADKVLASLVVTSHDGIGARLLKRMGWREGRPLGPHNVGNKEGNADRMDQKRAMFLRKMDLHGLGFQPFANAPEFEKVAGSRKSVLGSKSAPSSQRPGMFAIFDEEEGDFFQEEHDDICDVVTHDTGQPSHSHPRKISSIHIDGARKCFDGRGPAMGFLVFPGMQISQGLFHPPDVPADFQETHVWHTSGPGTNMCRVKEPLRAEKRTEILGLDILPGPPDVPVANNVSVPALANHRETLEPSVAVRALQGFMPYANDRAKQQRYQVYLKRAAGLVPLTEPFDLLKSEEMEFFRSGSLFRPLPALIASRFTPATNVPVPKEDTVEASGTISTLSQPAATRVTNAGTIRVQKYFIPHRLVCKRFNLPNPYTPAQIEDLQKRNADIVGLAKKEKEVLDRGTMETIITATMSTTALAQFQKAANAKEDAMKTAMAIAKTKNDDMTVLQEDIALTADKPTPRPPLDLFSAIFGDDDEPGLPGADTTAAKSPDPIQAHHPESEMKQESLDQTIKVMELAVASGGQGGQDAASHHLALPDDLNVRPIFQVAPTDNRFKKKKKQKPNQKSSVSAIAVTGLDWESRFQEGDDE